MAVSDVAEGRGHPGITARAVVIGLFLTVAHTVWLIYEELTLGHVGTSSSSPSMFTLVQTVIGILFAMMAVNGFLRRFRPAWMFTPAEFLVVFTMTTLGAIITSVKLLHYLFPTVLWPSYMPGQTAGPQTAQSLSPLLAPRDPALVHAFFAGMQDFWAFFRPQVFRAWLVPIAFWSAFFFLLLWTMLCLASVMRRPWLDEERLPFPVVDLPTTMAREGTLEALFRNRLLTISFSLTCLILSVNYAGSLYPSVPRLRMAEYDIGTPFFTSSPWSSVNPLLTVWWPFAIGLCYLIPLDVSFSCWFFFVAIRLVAVMATAFGWRDPGSVQNTEQFPYFGNLVEGGWIGMFLVVLWNARSFFRTVFQAIRRGERVPGDDTEAMPYRHALLGAAAGYLLLTGAGVLIGLRPVVSATAFALYYIAIIVMTRIYAQIAMPVFCMAFFSFTQWTTNFFGTARLSRTELATLTTFYWFDRTYEQLPMAHQLEAFVMADRLRQSKRRMMRIVAGTSALCVVLGIVTLLHIFYDRGATSARVTGDSAWLAQFAWSRFTVWMGNPKPVEAAPFVRGTVSALIVIGLTYLRSAWIGCPLHPIGYLLCVSFALEWGMWNVIFVTWLVKWLVVRYGGLRLYRASVPFFLGLVLGDCVTHFVWAVFLALIGAQGASPY